jgi:hypothetical protein
VHLQDADEDVGLGDTDVDIGGSTGDDGEADLVSGKHTDISCSSYCMRHRCSSHMLLLIQLEAAANYHCCGEIDAVMRLSGGARRIRCTSIHMSAAAAPADAAHTAPAGLSAAQAHIVAAEPANGVMESATDTTDTSGGHASIADGDVVVASKVNDMAAVSEVADGADSADLAPEGMADVGHMTMVS